MVMGNIGRSLKTFAFFASLYGAGFVLASAAARLAASSTLPAPLQRLIVAALLYAWTAWLVGAARSWNKGSPVPDAPTLPLSRAVLMGAAAAAGLLLLDWRVVIPAVRSFVSVPAPTQSADDAVRAALLLHPWPARSLLLGETVLNAAGEELFFRGLVYRRLKVAFGLRTALAASAALFALAHLSAATVVAALFGGLAYAALFEATGDLRAPIVAHALSNAVLKHWAGLL